MKKDRARTTCNFISIHAILLMEIKKGESIISLNCMDIEIFEHMFDEEERIEHKAIIEQLKRRLNVIEAESLRRTLWATIGEMLSSLDEEEAMRVLQEAKLNCRETG